MADTSPVCTIDDSDVSDSEATSIGIRNLEQSIIELRESCRRSHKRTKKETAKLKELKEQYERDYHHELQQREKEKENWQRIFAEKDKETKTLRHELTRLRRQIKQLLIEAKANTHQVQRMTHLICDICYVSEKCHVTRCGHGFCADCLSRWFDTAAQQATLSTGNVTAAEEAKCPACRTRLKREDDIWPLYLSKEAT